MSFPSESGGHAIYLNEDQTALARSVFAKSLRQCLRDLGAARRDVKLLESTSDTKPKFLALAREKRDGLQLLAKELAVLHGQFRR
jgi:hypothetical protein